MREADLLLWLSTTNGIGGVTIRKLHDFFGRWEAIWQADETELVRGAGIRKSAARELCKTRLTFDPLVVRREFEPAGIRFVSLADPDYPAQLHELYDPPAGLFVAGTLPPCGERALAVVGSRKPTAYGRMVTEKLVGSCAGQGLTIISGLARGIDTIAHEATLRAGGQTVAVLGSGLLNVYPQENVRLAQRIAEAGGAVLSEWHPRMVGKPGNFPVRNRIIAALAQGTLVVEAGEKSGSLITADQALEQGRDVYAIPGPITSPQSVGTNRLIQQGAKLVLNAEDLLEDYGRSCRGLFAEQASATAASANGETPSAEAVHLLEAMGHFEVTLDDLLARSGWPAGTLHTWLLRLQVQGKIAALPGGRYIRVEV